MTEPIADLEAVIYTVLNVASVTGASLATGGVWNLLAAQGTALPFVIFQWQGGGDENETPKRSRNLIYTVKALATTKVVATNISAACDALLHLQTLTITGWANFWTAREGDVNYIEVDPAGQTIYHVGGMYRIRIDK